MPEGTYKRVHPKTGEEEIDSQQWMIDHRGIWNNGD